MKLIHHIFRIVASLVTCGLFIFAIVKTESWLWLTVLCIAYLLICYVIIAIDESHEYPTDYDELISESESKQIIEISKSVPYSPNEIYTSYIILGSFELVKRAAFLSIHYAEDLIDVSNRIKYSIETIEANRDVFKDLKK